MTVEMDHYRDADGKLDWDRYERAKVAVGDTCKECGEHILTSGLSLWGRPPDRPFTPGPRKCYSCNALDTTLDESVHHSSMVRCPHCLHQQCCPGDDNYQLYEDGEHDFWCNECNKSFTVITHVSYEFQSPPVSEDSP